MSPSTQTQGTAAQTPPPTPTGTWSPRAALPPPPDWICELVALIPPTATYIVSGGLGIALPGWVAPALSLASYVAARYLLMCWPTQVRFS